VFGFDEGSTIPEGVYQVGPAMASRANEETVEVWQKDPSVPAFTDLLIRAIDKPAEQPAQLEHAGKDSGPLEMERTAAR
jgi:hypothetical protein